jgi:DNA modification methylase
MAETGTIFCGNAREVLLHKFAEGSVDLIYLDPPFFSNKHYEVIWGNGYEMKAFEDRWKGGIENYISWMEPIVRECHRVLKDTGSFYLHCDHHANAHLRLLLDGIFDGKFRNEIIWHKKGGIKAVTKVFPRKYDTILFYTKSKEYTFNIQRGPVEKNALYSRWIKQSRDGKTVLFDDFPRSDKVKFKDYVARFKVQHGRDPKPGDVLYEFEGAILDSVWDDIADIYRGQKERLGYPTQKPEALLGRIIEASSNKGDIVLDPMVGGGTTAAVAQQLGRRWIAVDVSPLACKMTERRLRRLGVTPRLVGMPMSIKSLRALEPFAFQEWVVEKLYGHPSPKKVGDKGIDGFLADGNPLQIKRSDAVGRNVVDNFETAIERMGKRAGMIVAFSFGKGAHEEAARVKNTKGVLIELKTVEQILEDMGAHDEELEALEWDEKRGNEEE